MKISSTWKYFLVVLCIANLIVAISRKKLQQEDERKKGLDLRGLLHRQFFVDTALADTTKNAVASPFSALLMLAALARGAVGYSLRELEASIGFKKQEIEDKFRQVLRDLSHMNNASLRISNKIYLQKGVQLQTLYRLVMERTFETTSQEVDFRSKRKTVKLINRWVSQKTNGKIKRMLDLSDIGQDVKMLLINTLDFVAYWQNPFREMRGRFKTPKGIKTVNLMERRGPYKYAECATLNAEIISIPYEGGNVEFHIVLPRKRSTLARLLDAVRSAPEALDNSFRRMKPVRMSLMIPMFQIEAKFDLVKLYEELGVNRIFQRKNAGLSDMVKSRTHNTSDLYVSKAIHKAFINVTATGTVAGAASATAMLFAINTEPIKRLYVDRPFLYMIVAAKQQLFSGTVVDPSFIEMN